MSLANTLRFRATRPTALAMLFALSVGLLACAVTLDRDGGQESVPPQGWKKSRGPVIPHDTFPKDCSICHVSTSWREIREDFHFDHEAMTGMPLLGAHAKAECLRCHNDRGPVEVFAARGCIGCHEDVHRGKLGSDCLDCHDQDDWTPNEQIARHNRTRFPLVGAHAATACWRCHEGAEVGNFDRTDIACVGCHRDDLASATSPDHQAQGWTDGCEECHIPTSWTGAAFNHSWFPLTGAHAQALCNDCHAGGVFPGTPSTCVGCHQDDYDATTNPPHAAAGIPTDCRQCHNTSGWEPASFPHTMFPLTGAHGTLDCAQCHVGGTFPGTPNTCVGCHQDDYDGTTNPNHAAAGFPTTCQSCHTTVRWDPASFNHRFPIQTGDHSGFACVDCHPSPGNFRVFDCLSCHDRPEMDDRHDDVGGYVYSSPACLSCHPNGQE